MQRKLLDLFCGAGGCGMGYHRAGFHVTGVDKVFHPRNPGNDMFYQEAFTFIQADALEYLAQHAHEYDVIHASPPCQFYCVLRNLHKGNPMQYPDLVAPTRELLRASGKLFVIENVPGAPLHDPFLLCGSMFGLETECGAQLRRHRLFETNWFKGQTPDCQHTRESISIVGHTPESRFDLPRTIGVYGTGQPVSGGRTRTVTVTGHSPMDGRRKTISVHGDHARQGNAASQRKRTITVTGSTPQQNVVRNTVRECFPVSAARTAMGIDWMTMAELSQAIPPAYTEWIGAHLMHYLLSQD